MQQMIQFLAGAGNSQVRRQRPGAGTLVVSVVTVEWGQHSRHRRQPDLALPPGLCVPVLGKVPIFSKFSVHGCKTDERPNSTY